MSWLDGITNSIDMSLIKLQDSEGQGSLVCCSSWGHRVRHDLATEQQPANQAGLAGRGKRGAEFAIRTVQGTERERRGLKQGDGQVFFKEKQTT